MGIISTNLISTRTGIFIFLLLFSFFSSFQTVSAQVEDDQLGAWYMYFWNTGIKESSFGFQGDLQYRNWNILGDLEQLLLRGGFTYETKNKDVKFTLGYANITTGAFGESTSTIKENRIYQEALLPHKVENAVFLTHRFRYEQRFVEEQDFRTRFRYALFINVPLTKPSLIKNCIYLAIYDEIFINGERNIGSNRRVSFFDRNRFYTALGYVLNDNLRVQLGIMEQTTSTWSKAQLQMSLHHAW